MVSTGDERFRFDTGKACGLSRLNVGTPVYKVGATTGMTKGRIINPHLTISVQTHARRGFSVTLHNQIEVEGVGQNGEQCKFSDNGDSGALVMMKTEDGEHMCIGIVEGGTCRGGNITNTTTVVTPIVPVLERLGVTTLKSFETKELSERIQAVENRLESLEKKLDQWGSAILSRLNPPAPGNNPSSSQANV